MEYSISRYLYKGIPSVEIKYVRDFDCVHIFECGQCFRWRKTTDGMYTGVAGGRAVKVEYIPEEANKGILHIINSDETDFNNFWRNYFDLDTDYSAIKDKLSCMDEHMERAVAFGNGIRLLKQEPFETLISFIISSNNNIPRIKGCIEKLSDRYGESIYLGDEVYKSFPTPDVLSKLSKEEISDCCKAGFRCAYITDTSRQYYAEGPFNDMSVSTLEEAEKRIMVYKGVGPKVGDCVLLFTGTRFDIFPVDVWVRRVMEDLYFKSSVSIKGIREFAKEYFGDLSGYAQQYLFFYIREAFVNRSFTVS